LPDRAEHWEQTTNDAITDVPGIKVGHWTDADAATGCSVVLCETGAMPGVDVRGASPGTHETDLLRPGYTATALHAVLLTGGSLFGMSAVGGVVRWCEEQGIGIVFARQRIPIVSAAVIFDLNLGRSDVRPDADAGYQAAASAGTGAVEQGSVGAGAGATVAKMRGGAARMKGGIGTASESFGDGLVVGAIVAVNALGDIIDSRDGSVVAGPRGQRGAYLDTLEALRRGNRRQREEPEEGNTTIAVVATNARLTKEQSNRLATVAHDGFARAIRPVHTSQDGDTIFAMATGERDLPAAGITALETFAVLAVERAIVKGVLAATSLAGVQSVGEWRDRGTVAP
jgi:L-aminopeptidase/D-esterase-like protein